MKDRFFLFIKRNRIRYDLIFIYFLAILGYLSERSIDFKVTLVTTLFSFLYLSYFEYLSAQKGKIYFFYNGRQLYLLRHYALKQSIKLSLVFIPVVLIACISSKQIDYLVSFIVTIIAFYTSNRIVSLNIEKKISAKIITANNMLISITFSTVILLVLTKLYSILATLS